MCTISSLSTHLVNVNMVKHWMNIEQRGQRAIKHCTIAPSGIYMRWRTSRYLPSFPAATACRLILYRKTNRQHRVDRPGRHSNLRSCHLPRELMQPTVPLGQKECLSRVQMTTAFNVITGFWFLPPEHVFVVRNHTAVDACVW